ncbi:MAG: hypothetical protein PHS41_09620 [Victivallaceae bacterium]|nr:hypothetical protein [Victivallaceae bacterium]
MSFFSKPYAVQCFRVELAPEELKERIGQKCPPDAGISLRRMRAAFGRNYTFFLKKTAADRRVLTLVPIGKNRNSAQTELTLKIQSAPNANESILEVTAQAAAWVPYFWGIYIGFAVLFMLLAAGFGQWRFLFFPVLVLGGAFCVFRVCRIMSESAVAEMLRDLQAMIDGCEAASRREKERREFGQCRLISPGQPRS